MGQFAVRVLILLAAEGQAFDFDSPPQGRRLAEVENLQLDGHDGASSRLLIYLTARAGPSGTDAATVRLSASPEGRVEFGAATFTIPANDPESPAVTVTAVDNDTDHSDEDEVVTLSGTLAGTSANPVLPVTLTVADDDTKGVTVAPTSLSPNEGGATAFYTVTLHSEPLTDVVVTPTSGYTDTVTVNTAAIDNTLTFTPSNWDTPQPLTVAAVQDADYDDESVPVTHAISGAGSGYESEASTG